MKVDNITLMMFVLNFVEFCFILELIHRLQLSRNLRDSPGFVDFVPGTGGPSYLSRKVTDWASEASPTLGCSIEISRDMYML